MSIRNARIIPYCKRLLLTVALLVAAAGCYREDDDEARTTANKQQQLQVSFLKVVWGPWKLDTEFQHDLEKKLNVKFIPTFVLSGEYDRMLDTLLMNGDLPDLVQLMPNGPQHYSSVQVKAIERGLFADLTPYIRSPNFAEDYPNLAQYPASVWDNLTYKGKIYGIPSNIEPETFDGVYIRKDLLDAAGLEMPATVDELADTLITLSAPPTRYGLEVNGARALDTAGLKSIAVAFTGVMNWAFDENGNFTYQNFMPEYTQYLLWLKKLYDAKAIHPEFALGSGAEYRKGQTVAKAHRWHSFVSTADPSNAVVPFIGVMDTAADSVLIPPVKGPKGWAVDANIGFYIQTVIHSAVGQENVPRYLKLIDQLASPEYKALAAYGVEGVHYVQKDGRKITLPAYNTECVTCWDFHHEPRDIMAETLRRGLKRPEEFVRTVQTIFSRYEEMNLSNPQYTFLSDTLMTRWDQLTKDLTGNRVKVVMGIMSLEAWEAYVDELVSSDIYKTIQQELKTAWLKYERK